MENRLRKTEDKRICLGIVAHVDAGKTTLSEAILYLTGSIRRLGRVDHGDTFLDTFALERARGITIFSKQARFTLEGTEFTLLDTPGHADFSAEAERTLQVLDYAVLVISGADGVQGHTVTLWKLLERYRIPVFVLVNKMDQEGTDRAALLAGLRGRFGDGCVDFGEDQDRETFLENLALCGESLLEEYTESGDLRTERIAEEIAERRIFPCYFGSALRLDGIEALLRGLARYTLRPARGSEFGARVYKISRDGQGSRLTWMKVTGGSLQVKMSLRGGAADGAAADGGAREAREEKVSQIRLYSGEKYETVQEVPAGTVCAVCGLTETFPGEGLGAEKGRTVPVLEPVLTYRVQFAQGCDARTALAGLRQIEEEEPELHVVWDAHLGEIHVQLMGEVQLEILKSLIAERCGMDAEFGEENIVYKETIAEPVEGIGHYEPLRHYAEVHLLLEPGEPGSGMEFASACSEEALDRNWQRLVLTHLAEKEHLGVLTGSPVTDMRITLLTGRAHPKHTMGGDFRQATYRAVRQGLKQAKSILLEPWYRFRLELPQNQIGRAMNDIQSMAGTFSPPEISGDAAVLQGSAPVAEMRNYSAQVSAYTGGRGRLFCTVEGYRPCHNADEVIAAAGYDSDADTENPAGSVFCSHGAGFWVDWDRVRDYMHTDSGWRAPAAGSARAAKEERAAADTVSPVGGSAGAAKQESADGASALSRQIFRGGAWGSSKEEKELEAIFTRTYGPVRRDRSVSPGVVVRDYTPPERRESGREEPQTEYLLVDGYNIIFAWEELRTLAEDNIDGARARLADILGNYQGAVGCELILVFDAYKVSGGTEKVLRENNLYIVYTREAETADQYIEKTAHRIARRHRVTVATSDALEQAIILGQGAMRMSARELHEEIERVGEELRREFLDRPVSGKNLLFGQADEELRRLLEDVRLGRKKL